MFSSMNNNNKRSGGRGDQIQPPPGKFTVQTPTNYLLQPPHHNFKSTTQPNNTTQTLQVERQATHALTALKYFETQLTSQTLTDVMVTCGAESVNCHKIMLAAFSQYFRNIFEGITTETRQNAIIPTHPNHVVLNHIKMTDFKVILEFIYTGEFKVDSEQFKTVMNAAEYLGIEKLSQQERVSQGFEEGLVGDDEEDEEDGSSSSGTGLMMGSHFSGSTNTTTSSFGFGSDPYLRMMSQRYSPWDTPPTTIDYSALLSSSMFSYSLNSLGSPLTSSNIGFNNDPLLLAAPDFQDGLYEPLPPGSMTLQQQLREMKLELQQNTDTPRDIGNPLCQNPSSQRFQQEPVMFYSGKRGGDSLLGLQQDSTRGLSIEKVNATTMKFSSEHHHHNKSFFETNQQQHQLISTTTTTGGGGASMNHHHQQRPFKISINDFKKLAGVEESLSSCVNNLANNSNGPPPPPRKFLRRYKIYSPADVRDAVEEVRSGVIGALAASRKYRIPSRTLYEKLKKFGVPVGGGGGGQEENGITKRKSSARDDGYDTNSRIDLSNRKIGFLEENSLSSVCSSSGVSSIGGHSPSSLSSSSGESGGGGGSSNDEEGLRSKIEARGDGVGCFGSSSEQLIL